MRVGTGFDAHAFEPGRSLVLGGVTIPDHAGLSGHSDADVLSHAIGDALLGAAGLGDLGAMFPADERWRDASGADLLGAIAGALLEARWQIVNVDSTLIAQSPRLDRHLVAMVGNTAAALGIETGAVSVKATTTDRLGFVGRGEGIAAMASVLIEPLM